MSKYKKIFFTGIIALIALIYSYWFLEEPEVTVVDDGAVRVHFIDVGQGDCELIELPEGKIMLIDAGDNGEEERILEYLENLNIEKIHYLVATHPHADHIGGMEEIMGVYDVEEMYMPKVTATSATFERMIDKISEKNIPVHTAEAGKTICDFSGVTAKIISPPKGRLYNDKNNNSAVVKLQYGDTVFLFMGDAETQAEQDILYSGENVACDVLKVGHHGSSTSSCISFLENAKPKYGVISCEVDNEFGHPHLETLENLDKIGTEVLRIDELGTIIIKTDGKNVAVER